MSERFVINTWAGPFTAATQSAFNAIKNGGDALDSVEQGCITCQDNQCDGTVGYGNHPDTTGRSSLDAMIMDGDTYDMGAVAYLKHHRQAISIARAVMYYTGHTLLVGEGAEEFADAFHFPRQEVTTNSSYNDYLQWKDSYCQPNFYTNIPEALYSCPPYPVAKTITDTKETKRPLFKAHRYDHDTIGIVTGVNGSMACGTSTNGANHKIAGRVGDSPIPGSGCYVDSDVGGAAATGDGDVMMRFAPSLQAVLYMKQGMAVAEACKKSIQSIFDKFPTFSGGMVCVSTTGEHAGVAVNMQFSYSYMAGDMDEVLVVPVA
eukprot:gene26169-31599_t